MPSKKAGGDVIPAEAGATKSWKQLDSGFLRKNDKWHFYAFDKSGKKDDPVKSPGTNGFAGRDVRQKPLCDVVHPRRSRRGENPQPQRI